MANKAVIPLGGRAKRLRPLSRAVPKGLWPLARAGGRVRPVVHWICAEAVSAGIDSVGLVVSPAEEQRFEAYFAAARESGDADLPQRVELIIQDRPRGFGDAVLAAAEFVGSDSFVLLLGDHVHVQDTGAPRCVRQVIEAWGAHAGQAMVGVQEIGAEQLSQVGVACGERVDGPVLRCTDFVEKPSPAQARDRLAAADLPVGRFLGHCGIYVFTPLIFDCLRALADVHRQTSEELGLAEAQAMLLERRPRDTYLVRIAGRAFDVGTPGGYARTAAEWLTHTLGGDQC